MTDNQAGTILFAWELGGGLGHLVRLVPIVRQLRQNGHRLVAAVRDLSRIDRILEGLDVCYLQAPVKTSRSPDRIDPLRSFAHILHNSGYSDPCELRAMVEGWRNLFALVEPDAILCDHSPTALLAARGYPVPVTAIGTGFCCPPDVCPLPDFRPWMPDAAEPLKQDENRVCENINRVLGARGGQPIARVSQLYRDVDATFLTTFPELDHYPRRANAEYFGVWSAGGKEQPVWPDVPGKRVFAYLKPFKTLPALLGFLGHGGNPTVVYLDPLDPKLAHHFESPSLRFARKRLDLRQVAQTCDLAILNAGHGSTATMLLAGKPLLEIPINLEQALNARVVERLGAGLMASLEQAGDISTKLTALIDDDQYAQAAGRFAAAHADFNPKESIERIVGRIEAFLERTSTTLEPRQPDDSDRVP